MKNSKICPKCQSHDIINLDNTSLHTQFTSIKTQATWKKLKRHIQSKMSIIHNKYATNTYLDSDKNSKNLYIHLKTKGNSKGLV